MNNLRRCNLCEQSKPPSKFGALASFRDGLHPSCRSCTNAYNRAKRSGQSALQRQRERDRLAQWRADHPERWKEMQAKSQARFRRSAKGKAHGERRRARERAAKTAAPPLSLAAVLARDGLACHLCTKAVDERLVTYDHVIPLARGGEHTIENLKVAHRSCNAWKGDRLVEELVGALPPEQDPWGKRREAKRRKALGDASRASWARDREARVAAMSNPSPEVIKRRAEGNRAVWAGKTAEERAEQGRSAYATRTPEQLAARAEKVRFAWARKTPEEKAAHAAKVSAAKKARGGGGSLENLRKGWAPEVRARALAAAAEARRDREVSAEEHARRSDAGRRAWASRRASVSGGVPAELG